VDPGSARAAAELKAYREAMRHPVDSGRSGDERVTVVGRRAGPGVGGGPATP
jgi:hypothetical protein